MNIDAQDDGQPHGNTEMSPDPERAVARIIAEVRSKHLRSPCYERVRRAQDCLSVRGAEASASGGDSAT